MSVNTQCACSENLCCCASATHSIHPSTVAAVDAASDFAAAAAAAPGNSDPVNLSAYCWQRHLAIWGLQPHLCPQPCRLPWSFCVPSSVVAHSLSQCWISWHLQKMCLSLFLTSPPPPWVTDPWVPSCRACPLGPGRHLWLPEAVRCAAVAHQSPPTQPLHTIKCLDAMRRSHRGASGSVVRWRFASPHQRPSLGLALARATLP
mmetsp:Transcript_92097/g.182910  ORF Transcript_92097/g.182910 Transcript_92097/m.182910 type:complete len:204 (-) Transcript_92097:278-889(-)